MGDVHDFGIAVEIGIAFQNGVISKRFQFGAIELKQRSVDDRDLAVLIDIAEDQRLFMIILCFV